MRKQELLAEALAEIRRLTLTPADLPFGVQPYPSRYAFAASLGKDFTSIVEAALPTGAATTAEDALDAVPPVAIGPAGDPVPAEDDGPPRRGDRVRLEHAASIAGSNVHGWFDVIGQTGRAFQVKDPAGDWMPYLLNSTPGLKKVRRGAANLSA